jgi:hypothetical protein
MRSIKHPCRHLETNPVLLPRQPTPTKIPAEFVENSVNMNSSTEERVPGIVHFADFVFGGSVLRTSSMRNVITKGSATGHPLRVTKWAGLRVRLHVGNIWVDCCATTTAKRHELLRSITSAAQKRALIVCIAICYSRATKVGPDS